MTTLPTIRVRDFYNELLEAFITEFVDPTELRLTLARRLTHDERDALELEMWSYFFNGGMPDNRLFCYTPKDVEDMDPVRIKAYRKIVDLMRPDWIYRVWDAARETNQTYKIINDSFLPPYPAVAILYNLIERGEVDEDFCDA